VTAGIVALGLVHVHDVEHEAGRVVTDGVPEREVLLGPPHGDRRCERPERLPV
jgi:hypothetical protein